VRASLRCVGLWASLQQTSQQAQNNGTYYLKEKGQAARW
jgi:hypothetical protein